MHLNVTNIFKIINKHIIFLIYKLLQYKKIIKETILQKNNNPNNKKKNKIKKVNLSKNIFKQLLTKKEINKRQSDLLKNLNNILDILLKNQILIKIIKNATPRIKKRVSNNKFCFRISNKIN